MSEIKSGRAREIIETCHRIVPCYSSEHDEWHDTEDTDAIDKSDAIKAIIKAESDARERAINAFEGACRHNNFGFCLLSITLRGAELCKECACESRDDFLNHYDNE